MFHWAIERFEEVINTVRTDGLPQYELESKKGAILFYLNNIAFHSTGIVALAKSNGIELNANPRYLALTDLALESLAGSTYIEQTSGFKQVREVQSYQLWWLPLYESFKPDDRVSKVLSLFPQSLYNGDMGGEPKYWISADLK